MTALTAVVLAAIAAVASAAVAALACAARYLRARERATRDRTALARRRAAIALLARFASDAALRVEVALRPTVGKSRPDGRVTEEEGALLKHTAFELTIAAVHAAAPGFIARAGITDPEQLVDLLDHLLETAAARHGAHSRATLPRPTRVGAARVTRA
jgi:hypothetical protein